MLAGVRAVIDFVREIIWQAKYDWETIKSLSDQYKNLDTDELW